MNSSNINEIKKEKEKDNINNNGININKEDKLKEGIGEEEETYEEIHFPKKKYEYTHDFEWKENLKKEAISIIKENNKKIESLEEFLDT